MREAHDHNPKGYHGHPKGDNLVLRASMVPYAQLKGAYCSFQIEDLNKPLEDDQGLRPCMVTLCLTKSTFLLAGASVTIMLVQSTRLSPFGCSW